MDQLRAERIRRTPVTFVRYSRRPGRTGGSLEIFFIPSMSRDPSSPSRVGKNSRRPFDGLTVTDEGGKADPNDNRMRHWLCDFCAFLRQLDRRSWREIRAGPAGPPGAGAHSYSARLGLNHSHFSDFT